jgi:hypothetical protein
VGRTTSVLNQRTTSFIALAAVVGAYYGTHQWWFELSLWWSVTWLCLLVIPAVFGLVWFALPLWRAPLRHLLVLAVSCGVAAVVLQAAGAGLVANFAKLATMTFLAWCFLRFFEELSWVVLVAFIVPWVDAYSVFRGPTKEITRHHEHVFFSLSIEFPIPGLDDAARLGLPDLLFFALYLGATARWGLRPGWTWVGLVAGLGATIVLATWLDVGGLPALPLLSVGFLLPNADLIWRSLRSRREPAGPTPGSDPGRG